VYTYSLPSLPLPDCLIIVHQALDSGGNSGGGSGGGGGGGSYGGGFAAAAAAVGSNPALLAVVSVLLEHGRGVIENE